MHIVDGVRVGIFFVKERKMTDKYFITEDEMAIILNTLEDAIYSIETDFHEQGVEFIRDAKERLRYVYDNKIDDKFMRGEK